MLISLNILGRSPVAGQAKTRLIPLLGERGAAQAHERMMSYVLTIASGWCQRDSGRKLAVWVAPDLDHPFFDALPSSVSRFCQPAGDLGCRLHWIAAAGLEKADAVVLLGADGVSVTAALLDQVESALKRVPAVLAPAADGGYILLGMTRLAPSLFSQMPWGTPQVAEQTRKRLEKLGWLWEEFPGQWDVDRPADWQRFQTHLLQKN
ncbi:MAG: TIGR04282 family arsenosugar biosynthesis glycosyltransferase [Magnetococcales bacterium]|nr:TIGR04282 family arsenosugar biosynthesis glycosyltransferase [Magnetococcales bacterium]